MIISKQRRVVVQERDKHLLRELAFMRVVDREQAKMVCGYQSVTRVNRRLLALTRAGLLKRFFIGAAGWKKSLYGLSRTGADLVQAYRRSPRKKNDEMVTVSSFLVHQLGINEIYCMLRYRPLPPGARFVRWDAPIRPIDSEHSLIPDGYVEISVSPQHTLAAFSEFDLGHENSGVWMGKVSKYLRYAIAGEFERALHHPQFRVLVVTDSEPRRDVLRKATAKLTDKIFWFTTIDVLRQNGFWSPIWLRPTGDQRLPLL